MRISCVTVLFVTSMLLISVFVANVANLISNDITDADTKSYDSAEYARPTGNGMGTMGDTTEHLLWFIQVSDLHLSIFHDLERITELQDFCHKTIDVIKPVVVLASGDLTDGKTSDSIGSGQFEQEWKHYRNILVENQVLEKTTWLDIRGNHDNFNVIDLNSKQNFFANYSVQGRTHTRSYSHQIRKDGEVYTFLAMDSCLDPGPKRPFNFVGLLTRNESEEVLRLAEESIKNGSKFIVWFGHYPTSCILSQGRDGVRSIIGRHRESMVYLCGHLHMLGGLVPNMYTLQKSGYLELELGDWKDNRMYRILAFDHGILSFVDVKHRSWPVILVTNPKHAQFVIPHRESMDTILESTHIRILVFSLSKIKKVVVKINDEPWKPCGHVNGPLYVLKWQPQEYSNGLHEISVSVADEDGRENTITQPFSLSGDRNSFGILARIALMSNVTMVFQAMFGLTVVICVLPLCILRYFHKLVKEGKKEKPKNTNRGCSKVWMRKMWLLCITNRIFYPVVLYPLYMCFGPWSVGFIIEDYVGAVFAWGILTRGAYLPGCFTYIYGFLQLLMFQIPMTLILAHNLDRRFHRLLNKQEKHHFTARSFFAHLPFFIIVSLQIAYAYLFWLAYGTMAVLLGPLRSWSIVYALILWHQSLTLPEQCMREAIGVWTKKPHTEPAESAEEELPNLL